MALIKCLECKKEISDTLKKCPHCGYKVKKDTDIKLILNKITSNKKLLLIISGVILVIIIAICINSFTGVKEHTDSKKLKEYLESTGYSCNTFDEDDSELCFYCHYCTNTTSNGVNQTIQIDYRNNHVSYKESAYDAYEFSISTSDYNTASKQTQIILYDDLVENQKFRFKGRAKNYFVVGETVNCNEYKYGKSKTICPEIISDVNSAMRLFESYFTNAGIKLGK